MSYTDKKSRKEFVKTWTGRGYEKGETQQFWLSLLTNILGYEHNDTVLFEHHTSTGGFIDVWIRQSDVMIEQKGIEIDLDKPELRQGVLKTPLQQVQDYAASLPLTEQPKYLLTCNFKTFRVYDRTKYGDKELVDHAFEFSLEDLAEHPEYLSCIVDPNNSRLRKEQVVSEQAGSLIGDLYDMLLKQYHDPDSDETKHSLNVLCVRLVFCLFCEDAGLFGEPDAFSNYLVKVEPSNIRLKLQHLFENLDKPRADRDEYDDDIKVFPYVNGGLFREKVVIPPFTQEIKEFILDKMALPVNWSAISPTIFGGIFESTLNPETRRKGGMHYTSPENIHKVIDPLFLDALKAEFNAIRTDEELSAIKKRNRYKKFHEKLCSLVFFDPACGSGNFLTETYICLRQLEYAVLKEYKSKQVSMFDSSVEGELTMRIKLDQFYGIEINDFAVAVAETALWISRLKANQEYLLLLDLDEKDFPLTDRANIICDNALRFNWNDLVEPSRVSYIMGNPPFVGASRCSDEQKNEIVSLYGNIKLSNSLDYVAGWYIKSAEYMSENHNIHAALVSTNSITQGEQIYPIWNTLIQRYSVRIDYAYNSFYWSSDSTDPAHVYCVIIGFSLGDNHAGYLYDSQSGEKILINSFSPYLKDLPIAIVQSIPRPLCDVPQMVLGNKPADDGNLILSTEERNILLRKNPSIEPLIRPYIGSEELIHGDMRYCLWLLGFNMNELEQYPEILPRINAVKQFRLNSSAKDTREKAKVPMEFFRTPVYDTDYLVIPSTTTSRRKYIPIGYCGKNTIPNNSTSVIPNASLYLFGVITSALHNGWMRVVCGRLGNGYRYTGKIVYNNFPWPAPTDEQKAIIEQTAQGILDARALYPDKSLADLYDPDKMPPELKAAHVANDKAVMDAYGFSYDMTEPQIVAELMKMYQELTE